ncbi:MAG: GtrA family protein [Bacteroidales bacterium]
MVDGKSKIDLSSCIRASIDFFYPLCRKYMTLQFFRYGVTGAANLVFDWVLYFVIYNFVLQHRMLNLGVVTLSSHIASLAIKFPIVFFSGFLLQKYVTFSSSDLHGRIQLFRYAIVFLINLFINYIGLKLLVDGLNVYPSISNMIISILTVFVSYFLQKRYTFKVSGIK